MTLTENLGKKARLMIVKQVDFGVYLGNSEEKVLLPKKQVPKGVETGDPVEVFLYKDSSDRLIATTNEPKITMGEIKALKVADTGKIGAFLDYPIEDVRSFIACKGRGGVMKGFWKVYHAPERARLTFQIYDMARLCAVNEFLAGMPMKDIVQRE